jgi:hypothetical protein
MEWKKRREEERIRQEGKIFLLIDLIKNLN